jgi:hypothetical protein
MTQFTMWATALALVCASGLQAQEPPVVLPGDPQLNASQIKPGRWTMEMRMTRPGAPEAVRSAQYELTKSTVKGKPALVYTMTLETPRGAMVDSTIVLESGLQPVQHRGHSPMRTLELNFDGVHVTGQYIEPNGSPKPIHSMGEQRVFDSAAVDLILMSLPLKTGYRARIPAYVYENGGAVWHELEVLREYEAESSSGKVPAYEVAVRTPEFSASYTIAKNSHVLIGTAATRGEMQFKVTRIDK